MFEITSLLADPRRGHQDGTFSRLAGIKESIMDEVRQATLRCFRRDTSHRKSWFQGLACRRHQTVVPAPAVSWRAASPLTTATSTQPELPTRAISVPESRSLYVLKIPSIRSPAISITHAPGAYPRADRHRCW